MITLAENRYGKSRVRLAKVKRHADRHEFQEWTLEILLEGDFESCFVEGDNSKILPTDTIKNTVYSLARTSSAECMEEFAKELIAFLLARNPQVSVVRVSASEKAWEYLHTGGKLHSLLLYNPAASARQQRLWQRGMPFPPSIPDWKTWSS